VTFAATAGQRYSILLDQLTLTGPLPQMKYTVSTPTGTALYSSTFNAGVKFIAPFTAAVTGTYKIKLDPGGANTGSVRVGVYQIVDTTGTVTLGSPPASPVTFTTAYPGQNGSLTFTTASANQRVAFWFEDSTYPAVDVFGALDAKLYSCTTPACTATTLVVAGGKSQSFKVPGDNTSLFRDAITLPTAGTYKWTFDPLQYTTGNFKLWAYAVPAPATAPLVLASATPATATTTVPGQTVTFTFSNTTARTASFIYDAGTSAGCVGNITVGPVVGAQIFPASTSITYEMGPSDQLGVPIPTTPTATNYQVTFDPADTCIGAVSFFMN
jgi:hypothetical protein